MAKIGIIGQLPTDMTTQVIEALQEKHDVVIINEVIKPEPMILYKTPDLVDLIDFRYDNIGSKYHK